MAERKFKAWDKRKKRMYQPGTLCSLHFDKGIPYAFRTWEDDMVLKEDLVLIQYAGVRDKNDKEIYFDSDIVEYTYESHIEPGAPPEEFTVCGTVISDSKAHIKPLCSNSRWRAISF